MRRACWDGSYGGDSERGEIVDGCGEASRWKNDEPREVGVRSASPIGRGPCVLWELRRVAVFLLCGGSAAEVKRVCSNMTYVQSARSRIN